MDAFNEELNAFKQRVKARARVRIEEAMAEYEAVSSRVCEFKYNSSLLCYY